jgi:CRP-like cAMP-binding protein
VVGERAALNTQVRSATVTALDEVSAMVMPAERFAEFLRGHPRAVEVLQHQVAERPGRRPGAAFSR